MRGTSSSVSPLARKVSTCLVRGRGGVRVSVRVRVRVGDRVRVRVGVRVRVRVKGPHVPEVERLPEVIDAVDEAALLGRGRRVRIVAALYHRFRARVHGRLVSVVSSVVSRVRGRLVSVVSSVVSKWFASRRVVSVVSTGSAVSVVSTSVVSIVSK